MDENKATIPFFVHEGEMARLERSNRRLSWVCATLGVSLVVIVCLILCQI